MLELDQVDLQDLCVALEDHSDWHGWWLDPRTGAIEMRSEDGGLEDDEPDATTAPELIAIEPIEPSVGYEDLVDFTQRVADPRARDLLERAIQGRGAFRRFKDTLFEFDDLREEWFSFHRVRMERRAIEWLDDVGLVSADVARVALAERSDPEPRRARDPLAIARDVRTELAAIYGERLRDVRLYGSWARGDAHPDSDIDLLIVLDRVSSRFEERRRIEDVLWQSSFENDVVVSAHPVGEDELERAESPFLARVRGEATAIA